MMLCGELCAVKVIEIWRSSGVPGGSGKDNARLTPAALVPY
jgi:hypothetical protein